MILEFDPRAVNPMQRPDEAKREAIVRVAAELFATRPFHEVRLEDVAEAAGVGKGTLYVYFKNKEDLYNSLVLEGFTQLIDRLVTHVQSATGTSWDRLALIVREFVSWAKRSPHFFQLMRPGPLQPPAAQYEKKRRELVKLIEATITQGNRNGEMHDPRPDLTAQFIPACVRGTLRFGPADVGQETLTNHILRVIGGGIRKEMQ